MQILYKNKNIVIDAKNHIAVLDLFKEEIAKSNNTIIACRYNNEVKGLKFKIPSDGTIELIDITDKDGMRVFQRGLIYIVAKAFHDIYLYIYHLYKLLLLQIPFHLAIYINYHIFVKPNHHKHFFQI